MDLELVFDFDPEKNATFETGKHTTSNVNSQKIKYDQKMRTCSSRRKAEDDCTNEALICTENCSSTLKKAFDEKDKKLNDDYSLSQDSSNSMSLSRSQKQNNIPSTFGTFKACRSNHTGQKTNGLYRHSQDKSTFGQEYSSPQSLSTNHSIDVYSKIRPLSARQPQITLREKVDLKANRLRPRSYDFSLTMNPIGQYENREKRYKQRTMHIFENFSEVIV